MKRFFVMLALLLMGVSAEAVTIYACRCDAGSDAACSTYVGANVNAGTAPALPKQDMPAAATFSGGNTLFLCAPGSWVLPDGYIVSTNYGSATPFKIDTYVPTGCTGSCATHVPRISCTNVDCSAMSWGIGGTASNKNGFQVNNIELHCTGAGGATIGLAISGDSNYFSLTNFYIHDCGFGVLSQGFLAAQGTTDGRNDFLKFQNGTVYNCKSEGMLFDAGFVTDIGTSTNVVIEKVLFDTNGYARYQLDHQLYFNGGLDVTIRHNKFVNSTNNGGTGCASTVIVMHGYLRRILIDDNWIEETVAVNAAGGCYGIQISPSTVPDNMDYVTVSNNRIVNVALGVSFQGPSHGVIANNHCILLLNTTLDRTCFTAQNLAANADPDTPSGATWMVNNSCYIKDGNALSLCYQNTAGGTGHRMVSNVAYFSGAPNTGVTGFDYGAHTISDFQYANYNAFWRVGGGGVFSNKGLNTAGFDVNSINSDLSTSSVTPVTPSWRIAFGSGPLTNAGHPTKSWRLGFQNKVATGARDIGACDYNAVADECGQSKTSTPDAPVWKTLQ